MQILDSSPFKDLCLSFDSVDDHAKFVIACTKKHAVIEGLAYEELKGNNHFQELLFYGLNAEHSRSFVEDVTNFLSRAVKKFINDNWSLVPTVPDSKEFALYKEIACYFDR